MAAGVALHAGEQGRALYAAYDKDEIVCVGTAAEVACELGVKPETVVWGSTPSARRRGCTRYWRIEDGGCDA
jgi:anthranilate phosphoribosyltransferase